MGDGAAGVDLARRRTGRPAAAAGLPASCHLFPEVSAHLLAVTPTAHWLEYVDWESLILIAPLEITASTAIPSASPGSGLEWDEDAIQRYLVS